jgi:hypothetical protein
MPEEHLIRALTTEGLQDLEVADPDERSLAGSHWNEVKRYLGTGETGRLDEFEGRTVAGFELETDPDVIDEREADGELDIERIYAHRR